MKQEGDSVKTNKSDQRNMQLSYSCHKDIRMFKYTWVQKGTGQIYGRKNKSLYNC